MSLDASHRNCPVCNARESKVLHEQRFLDGPMNNGYDVVVCSTCGAGFADRIPEQDKMDQYYRDHTKYAYDYADGNESPWDFKRFEATVAQIEPFVPMRDVRILDVGCATGGLLSVLKAKGYSNLLGADPSASCVEAAARLYGISVRQASFAEMTGWGERFDLILMLGVLEHVREANSAIRAISGLLNPGGMFYCAVPDVEGLADCPNAPYQQFSVEHVNFFSTSSLNRLFASCGLSNVRSWNWKVQWREGVMEPIASGLFRFGATPQPKFDNATAPSIARYLRYSEAEDREIIATIQKLVKSQTPLFVWGAGTFARRLLANTQFSSMNITAFVDADRQLQGTILAGRPVLAPEQMVGDRESVLICSVAFAGEIANTILNKLESRNPIITFLPVVTSKTQ